MLLDGAKSEGTSNDVCSPLSEALIRSAAHENFLFVTFTNQASALYAVNWALQLQAIHVSGLIGVVPNKGGAVGARPSDFRRHVTAIRRAGSATFCTTGEMIQRNGQAGRWQEVAPLLRYGLDVLISDADITWFRDPRPYFRRARHVHPHLDFLLCTDRAFNGYTTTRMGPAERGAGGGSADMSVDDAGDLDLEDGPLSSIPSYNIGIMMLYAHAASNISAMIEVLFLRAVSTPEYNKQGRQEPMNGGLARWDQGPINTRVLRGGRHPEDRVLVLIDRALPVAGDPFADAAGRRAARGPRVRLGMGVLPMLQFSNAYTYYIQADLRESLRVRPYSLHAIYSHGHDDYRKRALLREAHGWHDAEEYYRHPTRAYMTYSTSPSERAMREGGFDLILAQLKKFELALRIAMHANRTLVLPRLRCGNAAMAYPCYAWYHRATTSAGFRHDRVPMPQYCPSYYWLDHAMAESFPLRESSFLSNPRTPKALQRSRAVIQVCGGSNSPSCKAKEGAASEEGAPATVSVPPHASVAKLMRAFHHVASARVVHLADVSHLSLAAGEDRNLPPLPQRKGQVSGGIGELSPLSSGFWCTTCVVTRRGGVLQEINRSTHRDLERFCRTEARGALGWPMSRQTCCNRKTNGVRQTEGYPGGCPVCEAGEHRTWNQSRLSWHMGQWLPLWAGLGSPTEERGWKCLHPLCSASDPVKFP